MKIIRFYDDNTKVSGTMPLPLLVKGKNIPCNLEYCTYSNEKFINNDMPVMHVYDVATGEYTTKEGWDYEEGNEYYVFLDTFWYWEHEIIPEKVVELLKDSRVKLICTYTQFVDSAIEDAEAILKKAGLECITCYKIYPDFRTEGLEPFIEVLEEYVFNK